MAQPKRKGRSQTVCAVVAAVIIVATAANLGSALMYINDNYRSNTAGAAAASKNHSSSPGGLVVTRVISTFPDDSDDSDGKPKVLMSECRGEWVLDIRDGFVLELGMVGEIGGVVFDVSGGCCRASATMYSVSAEERGRSVCLTPHNGIIPCVVALQFDCGVWCHGAIM